MAEAASKEEQVPVPAKVSVKMLVMAAAGALILGLGVAATVFMFMGGERATQTTSQTNSSGDSQATAEGTPATGQGQEVGTIVLLEPFIVNLADYPEVRYLKITVNLELLGTQGETVLESRMPPVRDAILVLLSSKDSAGLRSAEGKFLLREEIAKRVNSLLPTPMIKDVYFTEFVVQ